MALRPLFALLLWAAASTSPAIEKATFSGCCFWCMEGPFANLPGVVSVTSGYTGGQKKNPTYEEVSSGSTGHAESVEVTYDPSKITYEKLLEVFWHNVDPTQANGQFCDHGAQYRSAIFYKDESQQRAAEASRGKLEGDPRFAGKIATEIVPASRFYRPAEYHQQFYKKNPAHYQ